MAHSRASSIPQWDQQLRDIAAWWLARAVDLSGLSLSEIARRAGMDYTTLMRMKAKRSTVAGERMDAISRVTGVPLPDLRDHLDYVQLYAQRLNPALGTGAGAGAARALEAAAATVAVVRSRARKGKRSGRG